MALTMRSLYFIFFNLNRTDQIACIAMRERYMTEIINDFRMRGWPS